MHKNNNRTIQRKTTSWLNNFPNFRHNCLPRVFSLCNWCELKHCWSQGYQWSTCTYVFHCQNRLVDYYYYWSLSYSAVLRCWADSLRSHVILHEWIAFYGAFFEYPPKWCTTALAWLVPQETAAISARSVYTIQPCTMALHAKPYT